MQVAPKAQLRAKFLPVLITLGIFLVVALISTMTNSPLIDRITTVMFINVIMVLGLQIFMGNSGLLSFAHVGFMRSEEHTSELQSRGHLVCRLLLETPSSISYT